MTILCLSIQFRTQCVRDTLRCAQVTPAAARHGQDAQARRLVLQNVAREIDGG